MPCVCTLKNAHTNTHISGSSAVLLIDCWGARQGSIYLVFVTGVISKRGVMPACIPQLWQMRRCSWYGVPVSLYSFHGCSLITNWRHSNCRGNCNYIFYTQLLASSPDFCFKFCLVTLDRRQSLTEKRASGILPYNVHVQTTPMSWLVSH